MRVLVVEDDDGVAGAVVEALGVHGHVAFRAATAAQVWARVRDADVVLLDLGLPDGDGLDVLRRLRRIADTPVLVLTARDAERDIVRGLRLGADDYLVKPVRLRELLARIEAVARRARPVAAPEDHDVVEVADLRVEIGARRATVADRELTLTSMEFDILAALARRAGSALSRQQLLDEIWGDAYLAVSRSLDVHVARLRSKIDRPGLLATIRGFGFRLGG
ncbi:response regulator transcription factor [Pseudonocardia sp. GCM10023141]|uniref:response regulator transcription factor n=1 Tax=Pseudonocardia sp. GCM10023141 TaxID=3252653 RepID=UPI00361C2D2D